MEPLLNTPGGVLDAVPEADGQPQYDWMRYLVIHYEPTDGPQTITVGLMRSIFGSRVPWSRAPRSPTRA